MTGTRFRKDSATGVKEGKVKGTKVGSKLRFLDETLGSEMRKRVISAMSPDDQETLRAVYDVGWYPIQLYRRLLETIVRIAGNGDERILDQLGRHSADKVATSYRSYYRSRQPLELLEKMVPLHTQLNDPGEMEVIRKGQSAVAIIVTAPPSVPLMCRVAKAFYRRNLELCGASQVSVEERSCSASGQEHCRFDLAWQ